MKKLLRLLIPLVLLTSMKAPAFDAVVQNDHTFTSDKTVLPPIVLHEQFGGELSGVTVRVQMHNCVLNRTLLPEVNLSAYPEAATPVIDGLYGSDIILLRFPIRVNPIESALIQLQDVPIMVDAEGESDITADFSATILNIYVLKEGIRLSHYEPVTPARVVLKYFNSSGKWWSGAVLTNDTDMETDVNLTFRMNGMVLTRAVSVPARDMLIVAFYDDYGGEGYLPIPELDDQRGYVKAELPPGCELTVLAGDGTQMVSL